MVGLTNVSVPLERPSVSLGLSRFLVLSLMVQMLPSDLESRSRSGWVTAELSTSRTLGLTVIVLEPIGGMLVEGCSKAIERLRNSHEVTSPRRSREELTSLKYLPFCACPVQQVGVQMAAQRPSSFHCRNR